MININERLDILHDDNGSFTSYTNELCNFSRSAATITYIQAEDSIYIGFYKPVNTFYVDLTTVSTQSNSMTVQYYNGSFSTPSGFIDDTDGFTRSGFVRWDRNQKDASDNLDELKTTVNTVEQYWYKLDFSGDTSEVVINGINIVFSDDEDLKRELFEIATYLPSGETKHLLTHVACRDEIIQSLNQQGKVKKNTTTGWLENITAFDLLDISQVKLASTYLALAKIMFNVSDQVDDAYLQKSQIYRSKYNDIINNMNLDVDYDDNGNKDKVERDNVIRGVIKRE